MQLICELFRSIYQNSSRLEGICYDAKQQVKRINARNITSNSTDRSSIYPNLSIETNKNASNNTIDMYNLNGNSDNNKINDDAIGAQYYLIVVICFYSLSIVFLLIFNIKIKLIIKKKSFYCVNSDQDNDLYESQKEETKNTIQLLFENSSKLITAITLPDRLPDLNTTLNARNKAFIIKDDDKSDENNKKKKEETTTLQLPSNNQDIKQNYYIESQL